MFSILSAAEVFGRLSVVGRVVDSHRAIVETSRYQIRIFRMKVQTHHATFGVVNELRVGWIL